MDHMERNRATAVLLVRLVLGLMFFQGALWRVFGIGPLGHARRFFVEPYAGSFLPEWALWFAGTAVPFAELAGGALVLLGLWRSARAGHVRAPPGRTALLDQWARHAPTHAPDLPAGRPGVVGSLQCR